MPHRRAVIIAALTCALLLALAGGLVGARAPQTQPRAAAANPSPRHAQSAVATSGAIPLRIFKLVAFTYNGNPQRLTRGATITLRFDPARHALGGRAGCNEYGAAYAPSGDRLDLSGLNYTQMACSLPGVMAQESRYLEAFAHITTYRLDPSGLTLRDATGGYLLRFA